VPKPGVNKSAANSGKTAKRKMPRGIPFVKGAPSPNPTGRPRSSTFDQAVRAGLADVDPLDPQARARADVMFDKIYQKAREGNLEAIEFLAERAGGKPLARQDAHVSVAPMVPTRWPHAGDTEEELKTRAARLGFEIVELPLPPELSRNIS
jgi:hypothetical protein